MNQSNALVATTTAAPSRLDYCAHQVVVYKLIRVNQLTSLGFTQACPN